MKEIRVIRRLQGFTDPQLAQLAINLDLIPEVERTRLVLQIAKQVARNGQWPDALTDVAEAKPKIERRPVIKFLDLYGPEEPRATRRRPSKPPAPAVTIDTYTLTETRERLLAEIMAERRERAALVTAVRRLKQSSDLEQRLKSAREHWITRGFEIERTRNMQVYQSVRRRVFAKPEINPAVKDRAYSTCRICRRRSSKLRLFVCPTCS